MTDTITKLTIEEVDAALRKFRLSWGSADLMAQPIEWQMSFQLADTMRENERLRDELLKYHQKDRMNKLYSSKHRGVVTVECEADKKYECFGAGGNSQSPKTRE